MFPLDLLGMVAQHLSTKSDLYSFLLASKPCYWAALPHLYEHLNIGLKHVKDEESWLKMLDERNKGLERICKVAFNEGAEDEDYWSDASSSTSQSSESNGSISNKDMTMCKLAERLLDLVPRNTLHEIRPPLLLDNPPRWYQKSFSRQREVRCIHLRPLQWDSTDEDARDVFRSLPKSFDKCIRLEVFPKDGADLQLIAAVAPKVRKIQELTIWPDSEMYRSEAYTYVQRTEAYTLDSLDDALLGPLLLAPCDTTFPALRSLTFVEADICSSAGAYVRYLPFDTLDHLELHNCTSNYDFLDAVLQSGSAKCARLSSLCIHCDFIEDDDLTGAIDHLLHRIEALVTLRLSIWGAIKQVDVAGIWKHIKSLQRLAYEGSVWIDRPSRSTDIGHTEVSALWAPEEAEALIAELNYRGIEYSIPEHNVQRGPIRSCVRTVPLSTGR